MQRGALFFSVFIDGFYGESTGVVADQPSVKAAPGAHSSLGRPCDISSCWKNPASARGLDQKALTPKSWRTPRLSWLRTPSKGFRPAPNGLFLGAR